jgi:hypothetical protein
VHLQYRICHHFPLYAVCHLYMTQLRLYMQKFIMYMLNALHIQVEILHIEVNPYMPSHPYMVLQERERLCPATQSTSNADPIESSDTFRSGLPTALLITVDLKQASRNISIDIKLGDAKHSNVKRL